MVETQVRSGIQRSLLSTRFGFVEFVFIVVVDGESTHKVR